MQAEKERCSRTGKQKSFENVSLHCRQCVVVVVGSGVVVVDTVVVDTVVVDTVVVSDGLVAVLLLVLVF